MQNGLTRRGLIGAGAAAATLPLIGSASAQAWPSKPIKIVCGYPAGGLTDLFARAYGDYISKQVGQPVIVENKSGAGGTVAALDVRRAAPDGYTLMFTITSTMIQNRVLYKSLPYDPDKDFVLISSMSAGQLPLVVSPETKATNLKEFVDYARKNDKVSIGTYGAGSYAHIAVAQLNKIFSLKIEPVHYRGEAPMWADLAGGSIQGAIGSYAAGAGVLQSGKGVPIAVPQTRRMSKLPNVATFVEQGVNDKAFRMRGFICLVGVAGTPMDIVERLSTLMVEGGKTEKVRQILETFGIDEASSGRADFIKLYDEEKPTWLEMVSSLGLTPE
jgi:tripartite-type tricarboxylate transporter receptor subunit TctC